jgi:hypothetical protein
LAVEHLLTRDELVARFGGSISYIDDAAGVDYLGLGRRDGKAGTRKMHTDLANSGVVTLDGDLIDA